MTLVVFGKDAPDPNLVATIDSVVDVRAAIEAELDGAELGGDVDRQEFGDDSAREVLEQLEYLVYT